MTTTQKGYKMKLEKMTLEELETAKQVANNYWLIYNTELFRKAYFEKIFNEQLRQIWELK